MFLSIFHYLYICYIRHILFVNVRVRLFSSTFLFSSVLTCYIYVYPCMNMYYIYIFINV